MSFREVRELVLGNNVKIARGVEMSGGKIEIADGTVIRRGTVINVSEHLRIGKDSIIGDHNRIDGRDIMLGRQFYSQHHAEIGGGSCFEEHSKLQVGYWFHLGRNGMINTAMPVTIGNEVGFGGFISTHTHGAYQSILKGFPVKFAPVTVGDNVWIPGAVVNPGVNIGSNTVIAVGSVVINDVPSGCLAGGVPCKVIKENCYPKALSVLEKQRHIEQISNTWTLGLKLTYPQVTYKVDKAIIDFDQMTFTGIASTKSERARNILRRHGIRFKVEVDHGNYRSWEPKNR